jgi:hypothetical protein
MPAISTLQQPSTIERRRMSSGVAAMDGSASNAWKGGRVVYGTGLEICIQLCGSNQPDFSALFRFFKLSPSSPILPCAIPSGANSCANATPDPRLKISPVRHIVG